MQSEFGSVEDLEARLRTLIACVDERRLVLVLGSGLSNGVVPDVDGMVRLFRDQLDAAGALRLDEIVADTEDRTLAYQNAASLVRHRAGERAVARAIRLAVLRANQSLSEDERVRVANDRDACAEMLADPGWRIPEGLRKLSSLYADLEGAQRGPIITTNFDPLMTLALRQAGIAAESIPVPLDSAPTGAQLGASLSLPVLHVHGYWTSDSTLNGVSQLTRHRPNLEGTLREVIRNSVVLVIGYSGWADAFMSSLRERVREADLLDSEVLWAAYESSVPSGGVVMELAGIPGFSAYLGVNGHELDVTGSVGITSRQPLQAPYGYSRVRVGGEYSDSEAQQFAGGAQPTWNDAGNWPMLEPARALLGAVRASVEDSNLPRLIVAAGPVGEGKSLGLRQVAVRLHDEFPDRTVIWREPGAPRFGAEWLAMVKTTYGRSIVFMDEADLIAQDLVACRQAWSSDDAVVLVGAMHDRLWKGPKAALAAEFVEVPFQGLSSSDASAIAETWGRFHLTPDSDTSAVAERLERSSGEGGIGSTLFGAILDVRFGDGLEARVRDLVDKLCKVRVAEERDLTIGLIFIGICLLQTTAENEDRVGASRAVIAQMANLPGVFADGRILTELGREAAISFAGQRVVARHATIARYAVKYAAEAGMLADVARAVGRAGAKLRAAGGVPPDDYRDAYMLGSALEQRQFALAAAEGALQGAPRLLEPRVTRISIIRRFDPEESLAYATAVSDHLDEFDDVRSAVRVFLNEYSVAARKQSQPMFAIGLAVLSLADDVGYTLDEPRAAYGLGSLYNSALDLRLQQPKLVADTPEAAYALASLLPRGPELTRNHFRHRRGDLGSIPTDPAAAAAAIVKECSSFVADAVDDMRAAHAFPKSPRLQDLLRITAQSART